MPSPDVSKFFSQGHTLTHSGWLSIKVLVVAKIFYLKDLCKYAANEWRLRASSSTQKCRADFEQTGRLAPHVASKMQLLLLMAFVHKMSDIVLSREKKIPEYVNKLYKAITGPHTIIYSGVWVLLYIYTKKVNRKYSDVLTEVLTLKHLDRTQAALMCQASVR